MGSSKRLFFITGEASGDMHSANLVRALKIEDSNLEIEAWGGDRLIQEGVTVRKHIKELAFMGFWEVVKNLKTILNNFKKCKEDILRFQPDVLVLVDYPGFNLRMAKWAKANNIRVFYYISPQIWAWNQKRVHEINRNVEEVFCILPFEKDFYRKWGREVHYLGHPLLDEVERFKNQKKSDATLQFKKPVLAVLPGSRKQELDRKLSIMLAAANEFEDYEVVIACAPNIDMAYFERFKNDKFHFIQGKTYEILKLASLSIVTSGTATLETALFRVPQVVCYRSSFASYWIARMLIKIKFISLVNLILDREVVEELIQQKCTSKEIVKALNKIASGENRDIMFKNYDELIHLLGEKGASERVAKAMIERI